VAVLSLLVVSLWIREAVPVNTEPTRTAPRSNSIAVLPFINTSPDSTDDYLGFGLASELSRGLADLPGMRVIPRASAVALLRQGHDSRAVGRGLQAGTLLEGSFRRAGDRLRVTAHLVDVNEGFDLWSDTFDRDVIELPAIQREIRDAVAGALRLPSVEDSTSRLGRTAASFEAYDAYLAGTYLLDQPGPAAAREATAHLNRAIRLDSGFAPAYLALAGSYLPRDGQELLPPRLVIPRAEAAARSALRLDSTMAEAHAIIGRIQFGYHRYWGAAESQFRRAVALEPTLPQVHQAYSRLLVALGRHDESVRAAERAVQLSRGTPRLIRYLGWVYLHTRQYDRALESLLRAIELDSTDWQTHIDLALLEETTGRHAEALSRLRVPLSLAPDEPEVQVALGRVYAKSGNIPESKAILTRLQDTAKEQYISPYLIGCLQSAVGLRNEAFASFDRAVAERSELVTYVRVDPRLDGLRSDRRFSRLLRRLQLP
jgi:serine/threonine-protein kinase